MTGEIEQSIPSRGSHGPAIAWALLRAEGSVAACHELLSLDEPVSRGQPQPTLTDEEREAIKAGIANCEDITYGGPNDEEAARVLRRLLERLG